MRRLYKKLATPGKLQTFISALPANFELKGETYMSPRRTLLAGRAHCMEGAMLAASVLRFHGQQPLVLDLRAKKPDQDHVVALFRRYGYWGAISKTNHAVLRYREPIYKTLRELALSYFHEYFDNDTGRKNLREYSVAVNLKRFDGLAWETTDKDLWDIVDAVDNARHFPLVPKAAERMLRRAEPVEIAAGKIIEWSKKGIRLTL